VKVLVTGGSSQIGNFLLPILVQQGYQCSAISRNPRSHEAGVEWLQGDLASDMGEVIGERRFDAWVHLAFLPTATAHVKLVAGTGVKHVIGFSSTSVFTKQASENDKENAVISRLLTAENEFETSCTAQHVAWTLFRPTMIYGCGLDRNISFIRSMIHTFGFFPLPAAAKGLRQPVHAADLALACAQALASRTGFNKAYNLSGGEVLSYRQMVERVCLAAGKKPRLLPLPTGLLKAALILLHLLPRFKHLNTEMVDRMSDDMVFSHDDARTDFQYAPRRFEP